MGKGHPQLHELLAVEKDLKGAFEKTHNETTALFNKKKAHFQGIRREYDPMVEGGEQQPTEQQDLVTNVPDELRFVAKHAVRYLDAIAQKEATNTTARADLVVDGQLLAEGLPATLLLALEGRLTQVRALYHAIPTTDPGTSWRWDKDSRRFVSPTVDKLRMKKVLRNHVKAEATKEHPAQVEMYSEDVPVGTWHETKFCSMLTPAEKSDLLERLDKVIRGVKQARQRANKEPVNKMLIGAKLFGYIIDPLGK